MRVYRSNKTPQPRPQASDSLRLRRPSLSAEVERGGGEYCRAKSRTWWYTEGMHAVTELSNRIELPSSCGMYAVTALPPAPRTGGNRTARDADATPRPRSRYASADDGDPFRHPAPGHPSTPVYQRRRPFRTRPLRAGSPDIRQPASRRRSRTQATTICPPPELVENAPAHALGTVPRRRPSFDSDVSQVFSPCSPAHKGYRCVGCYCWKERTRALSRHARRRACARKSRGCRTEQDAARNRQDDD